MQNQPFQSKQSLWRRFRSCSKRKQLALGCGVPLVILFLGMCTCSRVFPVTNTQASVTTQPTDTPTQNIQSEMPTATPISTPTNVPIKVPATATPISTPTDVPTQVPPTVNSKSVVATDGTPMLRGKQSDFYGKYGTPNNTNGNDAFWNLNSDGSLMLDARDTGNGNVGYLSVSTPEDWNNQKIKEFCLTFAPQNYSVDTVAPVVSDDTTVYDSTSGKFAIHVGYTLCQMNTIGDS